MQESGPLATILKIAEALDYGDRVIIGPKKLYELITHIDAERISNRFDQKDADDALSILAAYDADVVVAAGWDGEALTAYGALYRHACEEAQVGEKFTVLKRTGTEIIGRNVAA